MNRLKSLIARLLIVSMSAISLPLPAQAGMLPTEQALAGAPKERLATLLERADVQAALQARGVSAADVQSRVAAMTDDEASLVATKIDELPAGGFLGILVTIFLVLLITDILGLTKVFPFTKPICDRGRC